MRFGDEKIRLVNDIKPSSEILSSGALFDYDQLR